MAIRVSGPCLGQQQPQPLFSPARRDPREGIPWGEDRLAYALLVAADEFRKKIGREPHHAVTAELLQIALLALTGTPVTRSAFLPLERVLARNVRFWERVVR